MSVGTANLSAIARKTCGRRLAIQELDDVLSLPEARAAIRAHFLQQVLNDPKSFIKEVLQPFTPSSMIEDSSDASAEEKAREIQTALKTMQEATAKLQTLAPHMARQAADTPTPEGSNQSSSAPGGTPEWKAPEGGGAA